MQAWLTVELFELYVWQCKLSFQSSQLHNLVDRYKLFICQWSQVVCLPRYPLAVRAAILPRPRSVKKEKANFFRLFNALCSERIGYSGFFLYIILCHVYTMGMCRKALKHGSNPVMIFLFSIDCIKILHILCSVAKTNSLGHTLVTAPLKEPLWSRFLLL